jgi:hypothetical protein
MIRKLKGIIKAATLKKVLTSTEPQKRVISHTMDNGIHKITTAKSRFEIVPRGLHIWEVWQVSGAV